MPQIYGGKEDIISHFQYLLPFFKDSRYIKLNNKPVFIIYRTNNIVYYSEMVQTWNQLAKSEGFDGIYFVETLTVSQNKKGFIFSEACVYMEPMWILTKKNQFLRYLEIFKSPFKRNRRLSYTNLWKKILREELLGEKMYGGAFIDWDNSPRKNRGNLIIKGSSFVLFKEYFSKQYRKAFECNSPFIFINAWNEWAEGTYLEPDTKNGFKYLECIKEIISQNQV